jgi:hypothetical protein
MTCQRELVPSPVVLEAVGVRVIMWWLNRIHDALLQCGVAGEWAVCPRKWREMVRRLLEPRAGSAQTHPASSQQLSSYTPHCLGTCVSPIIMRREVYGRIAEVDLRCAARNLGGR